MKGMSKIAVLLNVILMGVLVYVWANPRRQGEAQAPAPQRLETQAQAAASQAAPMVVRQAEEARPFRWSQLLSTNGDYCVFVTNLRTAGCPEATVEDIVRGDTERVFYAKRRDLGIDGTKSGPWSVQAQMQLAAYLLGQTPAATAMSADAAPGNHSHPAETATLAGFLQTADLTAPGLNDVQRQQIAYLRQNLLEQLSFSNQAPGDPVVPASQPGVSTAPSSLIGMDGAPSSVAQTDSTQAGTDNTQPSQAVTGNKPPWWRPTSQRSRNSSAACWTSIRRSTPPGCSTTPRGRRA